MAFDDSLFIAMGVDEKGRGLYNVVVIGAGTAGLVTAAGTAALGGRVALVERARMGGDCLNTGCVPSKALIRSAKAVQEMRRAPTLGLDAVEPVFSFESILERMRERRAAIAPHDSKERFERLGVDVFLGEARFRSPREVVVGETVLRARNFVVATGSSASVPPIPGLDRTPYFTNENFFDEMTKAPRSILVLGGGAVGCELAQVLTRLSVEVHLVELLPRLLPRDDADAAAAVTARLSEEGVRLATNARVVSVESLGDPIVATIERSGRAQTIEVDALLVATGRKPNLLGLGLEAAGVEFDSRGVKVDRHLRTTQKHIYACGDVVGPFQLTHAADYQARLVVRNTAFPWAKAKADYRFLPRVTFTDPEVAQAGMTEEEAREAGTDFRMLRFDASDLDRAIVDGEETGFIKVLTPRGSDRLLGATVVGAHAGEVLHELVVAARHGIGLSKLAATVHAYPTYSLGVQAVSGLYLKTRLTPRVASFFRWLYRQRRRA